MLQTHRIVYSLAFEEVSRFDACNDFECWTAGVELRRFTMDDGRPQADRVSESILGYAYARGNARILFEVRLALNYVTPRRFCPIT